VTEKKKGGMQDNGIVQKNARGRMQGTGGFTHMKSKKTLLVVGATVGAAVVIAVVAIVAFRLGAGGNEPPVSAIGGRGVVATPENIEELRAKAEEPVQDGYYETRMNVDWKFPNARAESTNAYVENSTNNKRTVYFDLTLADTNELIYSSPFIPVGAKLEKFKLDVVLPAGEYAGIVTYHLVDDEYRDLTTVSVGVNLQIEK
jgi:hypothetical protein